MTPDRLPRTVAIELDDGQLMRVWEAGSGAPLLLLHGFTGSADSWGPRLLQRLATTNRVVAVDLLGHGMSAKPPNADRYAMPEVLADLRRLLNRLDLPSATWIGYSLGGRVALAAAVADPEAVDALVLESASPGIETADGRTARRQEDERRAVALETRGIEAFVDDWMSQPLFASQRRLPPEALEEARALRLAASATALSACLRGLGTGSQPSFWEQLPRVRCPALLVTGADDVKFCEIGERMAATLPRAEWTVVPDAGHQVHFEAPDAWLQVVERFLSARPGSSGSNAAGTGA